MRLFEYYVWSKLLSRKRQSILDVELTGGRGLIQLAWGALVWLVRMIWRGMAWIMRIKRPGATVVISGSNGLPETEPLDSTGSSGEPDPR